MMAAEIATAFLALVASAFLPLFFVYYETTKEHKNNQSNVEESVLAVAEVALRVRQRIEGRKSHGRRKHHRSNYQHGRARLCVVQADTYLQ
jgi:di/tripeptidase